MRFYGNFIILIGGKYMFNLNEGLWNYIYNTANLEPDTWKTVLLTVGFALAAVACGYLLGSINSAIIVSKILYKDDIRRHGSGNAGMTNMLRTYGLRAAVLTLSGDLLKTVFAVVIGSVLGGFGYFGGISIGGSCILPISSTEGFILPLNYMAGLAAVIGHILPVYYKFKGGKGVLCTATLALVLTPIEFAILLLVFVGMVAWSKYVSLGSVCVAVLYPVIVRFNSRLVLGMELSGITALCCIILAIFIVWCHRANLKRISERTENKISFKKVKKEEND